MKRSLIVAVLCLSAGCGADPEVVTQELRAAGPYGVGYKTIKVSYQTPLGEDRELDVFVWYPTDVREGERPLYGLLKASEVAVVDAPPLDLGPLPLVMFSHGHQAYASVMSYMMEHLASHGMIAVAPTHTGNTVINGDNRETDIYYLRALDISRTLDSVMQTEPISERRLIMGHSFGGYTAFSVAGATYPVDELMVACEQGEASEGFCSTLTEEKVQIFRDGLHDARFEAMISLDPGDYGLLREGVAAIDVPVLHMVAEQSDNPPGQPEQDEYWTALDGGDDRRVLLLGGAHNDFMDSCGIGILIRCSELPAPQVQAMVRTYVLAFARRWLMDDKDVRPLLDGEHTVSPLAEVNTR